VILGAFAESVKSVQALLTPLMVLLLVPYFLTLFLDLNDLPLDRPHRGDGHPVRLPFVAGPALFLGNYGVVWFGIFYQLAWFVVFVIIAARIFSTDRVLTMKLSLGRRRAKRWSRAPRRSRRQRRPPRRSTARGSATSSNAAVDAIGTPTYDSTSSG